MPQGRLLGAPSRGAPDQLVAEHYDREPSRPVTGSPLPVACAVDGIERSRVLSYRTVGGGGGRPVVLGYEAAGALDTRTQPGQHLIVEDLHIIVSYLDEQWARALPAGLPVTVLDAHQPDAIAAAAWDVIHRRRAELERHVVAHAPVRAGDYLLLDGSLVDAPPRDDLVAVVKTTAGRWTTDPAYTTLPLGWRSPGLLLRSLSRTQVDRFTCYVKLFDSGQCHEHRHGLVRVETTDPDLLDPLAAFVMTARLPASPRPGQLAPVQLVEDVLGARAPGVFSLPAC
jgi:hypothetical protein